MTRDELIAATRQLIDEGARLEAAPSLPSLQMWLQRSDDVLATAWGSMDRYHLAWLLVGKPKAIVRGRPMTPDEEAAYVREVAEQKTAALRMSLDAVERQGMPFVGETGGPRLGEGGPVPDRVPAPDRAPDRGVDRAPDRTGLPVDPALAERLAEARRQAEAHLDHDAPRAPPPGTDAAMTLAMGGTRTVPAPDPIARDYILLALRLDQHIPGLVDGYFGPADLKAQVDMEQLRSPSRLRDDAAALRARLPAEVVEPDRLDWLDAQLTSLETQAAILGGEEYPYLEQVSRYFAFQPPRRADEDFAEAASRIDDLLPGDGSLADRLAAWDERLVIGVDRLPGVVDWLVARNRERAAGLFGLPDGEDLRVSLVTDQPWSGYNWFDGGLRSRVDLNTDLPVRATDLVHVVAHETYPGHHLEHAWKEADLVDARGRMEASILLINTPECLISEGLADVGVGFVAPEDELVETLIEIFELGGLDAGRDPAMARDTAERSVALMTPRRALIPIRGNAAILRHADGRSHDEVLDYLVSVGRYTPAVAAKRLEFIEHPLWRTYVFVYAEGEALLQRWLGAVSPGDRPARFERLLHEQLTPGAILGESAAG